MNSPTTTTNLGNASILEAWGNDVVLNILPYHASGVGGGHTLYQNSETGKTALTHKNGNTWFETHSGYLLHTPGVPVAAQFERWMPI